MPWAKIAQNGAGWIKMLALILTFVASVSVLFSDVSLLNKVTDDHYKSIHSLQETQIVDNFRLGTLEKQLSVTDAKLSKVSDSINNLNVAITELTVTIREQGNKKG